MKPSGFYVDPLFYVDLPNGNQYKKEDVSK